ncbi:hypothetical protein GCM10007047_17870 [Cerasicoccus arenae]|uniref:Right handed beta helix domain-containing protein n=2 Tax=Cerasicoccus arenae TaxID=424488 RepID=A0A8J3DC54_9BACT|nr:hypothetical protein GCM10007047_17870 [Cerasicoccus arenae]
MAKWLLFRKGQNLNMRHLAYILLIMLPILASAGNGLQTLIDNAVATGENHVVIPAGEHRLDDGLRLDGLTDFTLEGDAAVLVFTQWNDGGILATNCKGLVLRGFTIDFDPLPFTQATVESKNPETGEVFFDVHDGYPDLSPKLLTGRAHIFNPNTLDWKKGAPDIYANEAKAITPRKGVLTFYSDRRHVFDAIEQGDYIVLDFRHSRGIRIENSGDVRIEDVTIWTVPSIGVICRFMDGENYFNYRIERGPTPEGANVPRLFSTCADGFNYAYARTGPILENCDFSFMGDDAVNLHGIAFYVAKVKGNVVYLLRPYSVEGYASVIRPGDEVRSMDPESFDIKGTATVSEFAVDQADAKEFASIAKSVWKSYAVKPGRYTVYRLELEGPLTVKTGDFIDIPAISAPGYIIRENNFHNHRGCGMRIMSSDGLIENNRIENVKQAAIKLGHELAFFREAGWVRNIKIVGNTIISVSFDPKLQAKSSYAPGAISVFHRGASSEAPWPASKHHDIIIENNLIEETGGPAIFLNQSRDVVIRNNTILDTNLDSSPKCGVDYGLNASLPISINNSTEVLVD